MSQFAAALEAAKVKIIKFDPDKQRPVSTDDGTMKIERFSSLLREKLGPQAVKFPEVFAALHSISGTEEMLKEHAKETGVLRKGGKVEMEIPPDMKNLTLNLNLSAKYKDEKFFLTYPDETVSPVSGEMYLMIHQMPPLEAASAARKVIPRYMPREPRGVTEIDNNGKIETTFNVYTPPLWRNYKGYKKLPDELPKTFRKLVTHLFPIEKEREYFFAWLYESLFNRAFVFLILCGPPGTGKNRIKLVYRALHGHANTIDGKKSTLVERFNSQLSESTLGWFDELKYDVEMENTMKELQNDSISIERKGVDATRGTKIHSSLVISNNKPRDNYIAPDARKFAPLVITKKRLEESMTPEEIDELTKKVEDETSDTFDVAYIAQIAKWVKKHGKSNKWPNLEYRGPMFWTLAHTSMTRWQKRAVMLIMDPTSKTERNGYNSTEGRFLWSTLQEKSLKKNGDRSLQFPDFTSVSAFFEMFRDSKGRKAFTTESVPENIMGDFWVKSIFKSVEIVTEAPTVSEQRKKANEKTKSKEDIDL